MNMVNIRIALSIKTLRVHTKFILLYETGKGNYTKERKELFKDIRVEEIIKEIKKIN